MNNIFKSNVRTTYAKIVALDWKENPIQEIQGNITAGSLSMNGDSAVRRTLSLTMNINVDLENIDSLIAINKKVKVALGLKTPFNEEIA